MSTIAMPEPDTATLDRKKLWRPLKLPLPVRWSLIPVKRALMNVTRWRPTAARRWRWYCPARRESIRRDGRCHQMGVKVIPRGAGTSLAGSLPADAVVLSTARLSDVIEINTADRYVRSSPDRSAVTGAVEDLGSSTRLIRPANSPAPSRQHRHEFRRCALPQVRRDNEQSPGRDDGAVRWEVIELGGPQADTSGYDLLGVVCGSEGQFGIVTEAVLKILPKPEGARPVLIGFDPAETAGCCGDHQIRRASGRDRVHGSLVHFRGQGVLRRRLP